MKAYNKIIFLIIVGLSGVIEVNAQQEYEKSKLVYFNIENVAKRVPYHKHIAEPYKLNDSVVCDLRFKKISNKLIVTKYKSDQYYSEGYAEPISIMKFKVDKPRIDTTCSEDPVTLELYCTIHKSYTAKLLDKIDYSKFKLD